PTLEMLSKIISSSMLIASMVFSIMTIVGTIFYGIYVFNLGEDYDLGVLKAGGILLIICDLIGLPQIGFLLIYVGLKRGESMTIS
ncbi:MAG: DUF973 family protein, partial [Candidatus Helarchaeales archaeon]